MLKKEELTVEAGSILWGIRVVVPDKWREKLLTEFHDHTGTCKMKAIALSYFWWPGLDQSIGRLAKSCAVSTSEESYAHCTTTSMELAHNSVSSCTH